MQGQAKLRRLKAVVRLQEDHGLALASWARAGCLASTPASHRHLGIYNNCAIILMERRTQRPLIAEATAERMAIGRAQGRAVRGGPPAWPAQTMAALAVLQHAKRS